MNAYANENLRMPAHYVDMSEKEMEYDGSGLFTFIASCVVSAVGFGCSVVAKRTNNEFLGHVGRACTVIGGVMSLFTIGGIAKSCILGVACTDMQILEGAYVASIGVGDIITGAALW